MEKNACTTTCNNTIGKCFNTILDTYTTYNMSNSYYTKGLFILAWTGLVSKISPRHSFLCKNIDVFI